MSEIGLASLPTSLSPGIGASPSSSMMLQPILGREEAIGAILDLLDDPDARLVSLLGPGGVGKTRLALEVAQRAAPRFAHGIRFLAFAGVPEASLIPGIVARELDIALIPGEDVLRQVVQALMPLHLLLVLDNMEHLAADSASYLGTILRSCPRLKLLATSRTALRVTGEMRHAVPPLPVPSAADLTPGNAGPAVDLFIRQAGAVRPGFSPDAGTVETIAAICRTVDGLPLAIELAAARVGVLSPAAILDRLDQRFDLLARSHRGSPARHRSLRTAIAWSYDLLPDSTQRLYRRLAVFVGGFGIEAVASVAAGSDGNALPEGTLGDLATLVDHHLVQPAGNDDPPRYTMLETIREFGLEALAGCGEEESARDAHAVSFQILTLRLGPEAAGPLARQVVPALRADWANIHQAAAWLAKRGRVDDAVAMYSAMYTFVLREDHAEEARDAFESWLLDPHLGEQARSIALLRSGCLSNYLGERERSEPRIAEATAIFRANGDLKHLATALVLGIPEPANPEEFEQSVARCREGLEIARQVGDPFIASNALHHLSWASAVQGDLDEACALARQWIEVARQAGMELVEANAASLLAGFLAERGDLDEAEAQLQSAASTYESQRIWFAFPKVQLASLAIQRDDVAAARAHLESALALAREPGSSRELSSVLITLAEVNLRECSLDQALRNAQDALAHFQRVSSQGGIAACFDIVAQVAVHEGDARNAALLLGASEAIERRVAYGQEQESHTIARQVVTETAGKLLGAEAFQAAIEEGASLPVEDVTAMARSWQLPAAASQSSSAAPDRKGLSDRELEVLRLMCDGLSNAAIARPLGISARTVTVHVSHILARLDVTSRTAAVAWAIRNAVA